MAESSATVEAPEREMTNCAAAIRAGKSEKNGAISTSTPSSIVGGTNGVGVFCPRLLHNRQSSAKVTAQAPDCRRHDFGHHARALAAAKTSKFCLDSIRRSSFPQQQ